jgi:hypothetical protein
MLLLLLACRASSALDSGASPSQDSGDPTTEDGGADSGDGGGMDGGTAGDSSGDGGGAADGGTDDSGGDGGTGSDGGDTGTPPGPCDRDARVIDQTSNLKADDLWCPQDTITLYGHVSLEAGHTLQIAAGTTISATWDGEEPGALVIDAGARIEAEGTADAPIVLQPLIGEKDTIELDGFELYGLAPGRRYPEGDPEDDSGVVRYLRVEAGGDEQAVRLDSVGRGTTFEYVAVVDASDDAFEIDGGTVSVSHLVVLLTHDDGIQWEDGFTGTIDHVYVELAHGAGVTTRNRDPDEDGGYTDEPRTNATLSNLTLLRAYSEGVYYDNAGLGTIHNLIIGDGGHCAFEIDDATLEHGGDTMVGVEAAIVGEADEVYCETDNGLTMESLVTGLLEEDPLLDGYMPMEGSPALDSTLADTDYATYLGAFEADDWTQPWAWK